MSQSTQAVVGSVVSLWRYPVKSMMGEELNASEVTERGLLGDRAYALVDSSDGKVASAKNPRKWPQLFDFRAALVDVPRPGAKVPPVRITLPDGTMVTSEQSDLNQVLSRALNREVTFDATERGQREVVESTFPNPWTPTAEEYWPDMEGLDYRDTVTDFELPEGTFFDCAVVGKLEIVQSGQLCAEPISTPDVREADDASPGEANALRSTGRRVQHRDR